MPMAGIYVTLLAGNKYAPLPASDLIKSLAQVEVTRVHAGRSGFQLTFRASRSEAFFNPVDFSVLLKRRLHPFNRIVLIATINLIPYVLIDGVITDQQLTPEGADQASLVVTGEDLSVLMDMKEEVVEHHALPEIGIAAKILAEYLPFGVVPDLRPPPSIDVPIPIERVPVQHGTDLDYLETMAERYGFIFSIRPGPLPLMNRAFWGPPIAIGIPQKALTMNMGKDDNLNSINFRYDALAPERVQGRVQDKLLNQGLPFMTFAAARPPLESQPAILAQAGDVRQRWNSDVAGLDYKGSLARAQGMTDSSVDEVVIAEGELDGIRYARALNVGSLVGVRGVGYSYDGFYYVRQVTHSITLGQPEDTPSYTQKFSLQRGGLGSLSPVVPP